MAHRGGQITCSVPPSSRHRRSGDASHEIAKGARLGLLDRFKGKKKSQPEAPDPEQKTNQDAPSVPDVPETSASQPTEQPDMTEQWLGRQQSPATPPSEAQERFTGVAGTIKPLTYSQPVETGDPAQATPAPKTEPAPAREVEPVGEEQIDRLTAQAMKGHSSKDIEALWDALLSKRELHILQRGKADRTEAHAVESPLGPMLLFFSAKFRAEALVGTKPFRNSPFVWKIATMPTEDALAWLFEQQKQGVQAVEFNRSDQPGLASVLQAIPARYERVYGKRPRNTDLVDPDFSALAERSRIAGHADAHRELLDAFFSLQRWYALRDPKRPNQPGFSLIDQQPALMLFTSEAQARLAAENAGRQRELPKVIMPVVPSKIAGWMAGLPAQGAQQAVVNPASSAFVVPLEGIDRQIAGRSSSAGQSSSDSSMSRE